MAFRPIRKSDTGIETYFITSKNSREIIIENNNTDNIQLNNIYIILSDFGNSATIPSERKHQLSVGISGLPRRYDFIIFSLI